MKNELPLARIADDLRLHRFFAASGAYTHGGETTLEGPGDILMVLPLRLPERAERGSPFRGSASIEQLTSAFGEHALTLEPSSEALATVCDEEGPLFDLNAGIAANPWDPDQPCSWVSFNRREPARFFRDQRRDECVPLIEASLRGIGGRKPLRSSAEAERLALTAAKSQFGTLGPQMRATPLEPGRAERVDVRVWRMDQRVPKERMFAVSRLPSEVLIAAEDLPPRGITR